jgi:DNA-binding MarR family transcriptional regulator
LTGYVYYLYKNAMEKRLLKLAQTLVRVINKFVANEKKSRYFGVPERMHASEIHMVMHIGDNPGMHVSELARIAGVTRGAVSQQVAKLEKKGLVTKTGDPQNSLKTVPVLTNKGKVAYYAHARHHEEVDEELFDFVNRLSDGEFALIEDFLNHLDKMADRLG